MIAVITPTDWLRQRLGAARSLTLPPLIKWSEFPVIPYHTKTTVAVFLSAETEKVWDLSYMAEQLPKIHFVAYRPAVTGHVTMRANLRYEKIPYHRHKVWAQARLLLIPVAYPEALLHATEAVQSGIPLLIDGDAHQLAEIVGPGGVTIPVSDVAAWVAVTDRLMTDAAAFETQARRRRAPPQAVQTVLPFLEQLSR
jgi:hypothetical protein